MELEPISLYLELAPGEVADLEVVARASLAFVQAIREVAFVVDPGIDISVGLSSGTEGSLSLNSVIMAIKKFATPDKAKLKVIALVILGWFGNDVRTYGVIETLNMLFKGVDARQNLSDDDINRIAVEITRVMDSGVGRKQVERVYRELDRDKRVQGVGASQAQNVRPPVIVPRSDFRRRGGMLEESVAIIGSSSRSRTYPIRVTLISPVLIPGTRKWKFLSYSEGEFGAHMRDYVFLQRTLTGANYLSMKEGIEMDVLMEVTEKLVDGVWVIRDRSITHVIEVHYKDPTTTQSNLQLPSA